MGPAGQVLNSSYANRESKACKEDLGNAVVNFARMIPGGMLVFFPAYAVMRDCVDTWKAAYGSGQGWGSSIWERITAHKQPVVEPQVSLDSHRLSHGLGSLDMPPWGREHLSRAYPSGPDICWICRQAVAYPTTEA